jgi:hypothetical protein
MTAFGGGAFPPGIPAGGGGGGSRPSGMVLTRPRIADFTKFGNGTVSDIDPGVLFSVPDSAGAQTNRTTILQAKPASTPWTIYAQWAVPWPDYAGEMSFAINESSTGKYVTFGSYVEQFNRVFVVYNKWSNLTTIASASTSFDSFATANGYFSLSHTASGNFDFRFSLSGIAGTYALLQRFSVTDYLSTYDRIGLAGGSYDDVAAESSQIAVTHWSTSPPTWVVGSV